MFRGFGERPPQRRSVQEGLEHLKDELRNLENELDRIEEKLRKGDGDTKKLEQEKQRLLGLIADVERKIRNKKDDLEAPETLDEKITRSKEGEPSKDKALTKEMEGEDAWKRRAGMDE